MRKFAIGTALLSLIAGVVGFVLRNLYLTRAIEPDTGLPVLSSPSLLMMVFYSLFIIALAFALSLIASRSFGSRDDYVAITTPMNLFYRISTGMACVLMLVSGVMGIIPLMSAADMDYPSLIRSSMIALTGACLIGLTHEVSTKKEFKGAYTFSIIPEIAITFWLLGYYRANQTNPTQLSYVFFALALAASTFSFYFTASYVYGRRAPLRFIFSHTTAIYFLIMTLADDIPIHEKLCVAGLALFFLVNLSWFVSNLMSKKKTRQKAAVAVAAEPSVFVEQETPEKLALSEATEKIRIVNFKARHATLAAKIARQNYEEARRNVPALPEIDEMPDLTMFAENNLGVAAFEEGEMVGFLCSVPPFANAFRTTNATGVFSPMGANGAIGANRAEIYARMYQAAGEKWAAAGAVAPATAGATSHAICLYANDKEVQEQFFRYGFGLRCVDAVREMEELVAPSFSKYDFRELLPKELQLIFPLNKLLVEHLKSSPTFLHYPHIDDAELMKMITQPDVRYFAAFSGEDMIAYAKLSDDGENFASEAPEMMNICGAFCLPEYRGTGLFQRLLNFAIQTLKAEGLTRLGVDFESFNPNAYGFWLKYFTAYTHSVVRRIDENAAALLTGNAANKQ